VRRLEGLEVESVRVLRARPAEWRSVVMLLVLLEGGICGIWRGKTDFVYVIELLDALCFCERLEA